MFDIPIDIVEFLILPLVVLGIIGFLVALMVWALVMQRQGLTKQKQAISHVEESMVISRRSVENQEINEVHSQVGAWLTLAGKNVSTT